MFLSRGKIELIELFTFEPKVQCVSKETIADVPEILDFKTWSYK